MHRPHRNTLSADDWRAVATLDIAMLSEEEGSPFSPIADCLRSQSLPPAILERLRDTVETAMQRMAQANTAHILVHIYCLTAGDLPLSAAAKPSWGFFLVEKRRSPRTALDLQSAVGDQLSIYVYQENLA